MRNRSPSPHVTSTGAIACSTTCCHERAALHHGPATRRPTCTSSGAARTAAAIAVASAVSVSVFLGCGGQGSSESGPAAAGGQAGAWSDASAGGSTSGTGGVSAPGGGGGAGASVSECGNGSVEPGETCDPAVPSGPGSCPTICSDGVACTLDILQGAKATCNVACTFMPTTDCADGDGCCPSGCTPASDHDCSPTCGNGVVDLGEMCDGNCPTSCKDGNSCTLDALVGSAATCSAECSFAPITACSSGDGCCPSGCNTANDSDCSPTCGNGVVDSGETCDGNCPASCDDANACTSDALAGSAATCSAACSFASITACKSSDGCCPAGCSAVIDDDCSPTCGNDTVEPGETCDGNCPGKCDDGIACTKDTLVGSAATCSAACSFAPLSSCAAGDGCCVPGCTSVTDDDCSPVWTKVAPVTPSWLYGVWAAASNDVWAVGDTGIILHYDAKGWAPVPSGTTAALGRVHGTSAKDIWATGYWNGTVLHYDGVKWSVVLQSNDFKFHDVWTVSPSDVWFAYEYCADGPLGPICGMGAMLRFTGGDPTDSWNWTSYPLDPGVTGAAYAVWGSSATDLWVGGADGDLHHYDGTYDGSFYWHDAASAMTGNNSNAAGWSTGTAATWVAVTGKGMAHFDGISWSMPPSPDPAATYVADMWGSGPTNVWAVGSVSPSFSGRIIHFDGLAWGVSPSPAVKQLLGVSGTSPKDVWAVGEDGVILHYQ